MRVTLVLSCLLVISLISVAWSFRGRRPRAWKAEEVPVAFWAWRNESPAETEVRQAFDATRAQALFLRASQIDYGNRKLTRIRELSGKFPREVELQLVYNGTRALLAEFEQVDVNALAALLADSFKVDAARAAQDGARIVGMQLDLDVPTRLLGRYGQVLRVLRERLPAGMKLSVTGLPTWMDSAAALAEMLKAVDFWIPQAYGAQIPERLDQLVPVSSPALVARTIARVRQFETPFYAGLPAYGYAVLYSSKGQLIEVRGDLDPARIAVDANFELIERRPFTRTPRSEASGQTPLASEWRYVYRARDEGVIDGLVVHEGESLMLDVPTAETLRAYARAVREEAGEKLLGICVFRLPVKSDATVLTLEQIRAALADAPPSVDTVIKLERGMQDESGAQLSSNLLQITATNDGAATARMGDDAMTLTLRVPAGSVRGVTGLDGFSSIETLCQTESLTGDSPRIFQRQCSIRRANIFRLRTRTWMPGAKARAALSFDDAPPSALEVSTEIKVDDGRVFTEASTIDLNTR